MNSRISDMKISSCLSNREPEHNWYKVWFMVDNKWHWMVYDKPDELAVYAALQECINNCYPEGE